MRFNYLYLNQVIGQSQQLHNVSQLFKSVLLNALGQQKYTIHIFALSLGSWGYTDCESSSFNIEAQNDNSLLMATGAFYLHENGTRNNLSKISLTMHMCKVRGISSNIAACSNLVWDTSMLNERTKRFKFCECGDWHVGDLPVFNLTFTRTL